MYLQTAPKTIVQPVIAKDANNRVTLGDQVKSQDNLLNLQNGVYISILGHRTSYFVVRGDSYYQTTISEALELLPLVSKVNPWISLLTRTINLFSTLKTIDTETVTEIETVIKTVKEPETVTEKVNHYETFFSGIVSALESLETIEPVTATLEPSPAIESPKQPKVSKPKSKPVKSQIRGTRELILEFLTKIKHLVPRKPIHPILEYVEFISKDDSTTLGYSNLSTEVVTTIENININACLDFKELLAVVKNSDTLEFSLNNDTVKVNGIVIDSSHVDEYPNKFELVTGSKFSIPNLDLVSAIKFTENAISKDETKQVLTGLHISAKDGVADIYTTDGHRLAFTSTQHNGDNCQVTISKDLLKFLARCTDDFNFTVDADFYTTVNTGAYKITSRNIQGQYPNCANLIPNKFDREFTVNSKELTKAIEQLKPIWSATTEKAVTLTFTKSKLTVNNLDSQVELECDASQGETYEVTFRSNYLLDALKAHRSLTITFNCNRPNQPVIVTSKQPGGYLLMPFELKK
jgi:DNA polymerase III subunit beta